jgi:uncharacterized membrane protein HdeD (DUF308 family)
VKEGIMNELREAASTGGKRVTVLGAIVIILGIFALMAPGLTGISIVFLLGTLVAASGIIRIVWAFQAGSFGRGLLMFAIGGLTLLCGIALIANPLLGSAMLTFMLTAYFIFDGIAEIAAGVRLRPEAGWGWMLFGGIVSILLGIVIWAQFPLSGAWAIGILLGIKMFFIGLIMVTGGSAVRSLAKA